MFNNQNKAIKRENLKADLTKRQFEVFELVTKGFTDKKIADFLFISEVTVRKHKSNISKSQKVKNIEELLTLYDSTFQLSHQNVTSTFDLSWNDSNLFDHYFSKFSEVIEAMCKLNFSKRLHETNDKNSLLNFIAQSLNAVNEELEGKYIGGHLMPKILDLLDKKNRIVLLSKDKEMVSHYFDTINGGIQQDFNFVGQNLNVFFETDKLYELKEDESLKFNANLKHKLIPLQLKGNAEFELTLIQDYLIVTIDTSHEERLRSQMPRILCLLSCVKSQYEDNPHLADSILGKTVITELDIIFSEYKEFAFQSD